MTNEPSEPTPDTGPDREPSPDPAADAEAGAGAEPGDAPGASHTSAANGGPGLADSATKGFVFLGIQTIAVRLIRFAGTFTLAWLLVPDDFTLFVLVLTISQFVSVLRNAGIRDIIVQRQERARKWVNPGVWLSGTIGFALAVVMAAAAPLVSTFFERPELTAMIWIMSGAALFQSLAQVPVGLLQAQMKFRLLAMIEGVHNTGIMVLTVYCAFMGMGAMSFVVPLLVGASGRTAALWFYARPRVSASPQTRRWKYLVSDSVKLVSADVARTVTLQGDIIILGKFFPGLDTVGHYAFGNNISRQSMMMFSRNLDLVLFPSLSKIQRNAQRQTAAFVRALRLLATAGVPLCFLQAAVADPLIHTLVPERFYGTIPFIVVLSIGMAGRLMISPAESMLRSQNRFGMFSRLNWIFAGLFTLAALLGALWGGNPMSVATAIAVVTGLGGIVYVLVALSRSESPVRATAGVFTVPVLAAGAACGSAWWTSTLIPRDGVVNGVLAGAVIVAMTGLIYIPIIWFFSRDVCDEFKDRALSIIGTRFRRKTRPA